MRYILILLLSFSSVSCTVAQYYSTKDKKAIKLFEEGKAAPGQSIDYTTNTPNFREGIRLMEAAVQRDPNFWEAHMFAGEYYEMLRDYKPAIAHYEKALQINPNHSPSGSTHFYLGNLQHAVGDYENAVRNLDLFERNPNANPELIGQARHIRESCEFAANSMKNPNNIHPINIGPGINTQYMEYFPTITVDGKTLLFTRRIPDNRVEGPIKEQEDFFVSQLGSNNIWGTATPMPTNINTVLNEGAPTLAPDGRSLVFVACADKVTGNNYGPGRDGFGSCDLFYTKRLGTQWTNPENLPGTVNSFGWESQPSLSSDGRTLYFIRRVSKQGETPNSDIFVTHLQADGQWSKAERLPAIINSPEMEESVLIHPDGKTLYFASRGHVGMGGLDIFMSRLDSKGNWSKPENLGYPINTGYDENSLLVSADGEIAFFASDRDGGYGGLDIYYFELPESLRPTKTLYFEGIVFDVNTRKPIPGKFQLIDLETGKEVIVSEADKVSGEFTVPLPVDRQYALNVEYPGYTFFSKNFDLTIPENQDVYHMDVPMVPLNDNNHAVVLANVFFDLNKATLRKESFVELDKLVSFLQTNATLRIELGGHTDSRGNNNDELSLNRAKAVYDYVVSKGIEAKRLEYKGYGSRQPVYTDEQINAMSSEKEKEAAHQANRRTEYKILAK
jgi:outer membrane protein OmpA-like peptidoglycan-associated protein/Tol biopolymer transport system component